MIIFNYFSYDCQAFCDQMELLKKLILSVLHVSLMNIHFPPSSFYLSIIQSCIPSILARAKGRKDEGRTDQVTRGGIREGAETGSLERTGTKFKPSCPTSLYINSPPPPPPDFTPMFQIFPLFSLFFPIFFVRRHFLIFFVVVLTITPDIKTFHMDIKIWRVWYILTWNNSIPISLLQNNSVAFFALYAQSLVWQTCSFAQNNRN